MIEKTLPHTPSPHSSHENVTGNGRQVKSLIAKFKWIGKGPYINEGLDDLT